MSDVAKLYRERFLSLFPGLANKITKEAYRFAPVILSFETLDLFFHRHHVPSFSQLTLDGTSKERPFANSLTLTLADFANLQHRDRDFAPIVFGAWWTAKHKQFRDFEFNMDHDHDKVKGGGFVWGDYKLGVDFER